MRLIELRNEFGFSQGEVAEKLGISRQAYGHYETGAREPDYSTIIKLSEIYGVTTDYLLGISETKTSTAEITTEDVKVALFDGDKEVTDEMWEEVKSFVEFVKSKHEKDKRGT